MSVDPNAVIESARSVAKVFAAEAAEAERLRRPTDAAIAALVDSGVLRLMVPEIYGGFEAELDLYFDVILALSAGDTSLSWVANFYIEHHWWFCQFPRTFQDEVFAAGPVVLAPASLAPNGTAEAVEGGWRLTGRWPWSSGVMHASWVIVGGLGQAGAERREARFFALPRAVWFIDGMSGTGSNDVVVDGAFVPAERAVSMTGMSSGRGLASEIHQAPLYRTPMLPILMLAATVPAIGAAQRGLAFFRDRLGDRKMANSVALHGDRASSQVRLARAEVMDRRDQATKLDRARWVAVLASIVHDCRATLLSISEASGATAHFLGSALQRDVRDVNTMCGHMVFDLDGALENYGRLTLGKEPSSLVF
jgi:alkylation response protein AidB-like acyl-CoA dehydrogenase